MIHRTDSALQVISWQQQLSDGFSQPADLISYLDLDPALLSGSEEAHQQFKIRLPRWFADRMERGNPADPLLRQFLPSGQESADSPGFSADPVHDLDQSPTPGVLHKYRGRVLLVTTGACAVNCRYCFRRHYPYQEASTGHDHWVDGLNYLRENSEVTEVILSGGDPLMLPDRHLTRLISQLEKIPHLKRLRIHTRMPVILPSRLTQALSHTLTETQLETLVVIHANHPRELSDELRTALHPLQQAGITLLNQSVILKGVNNIADTLSDLSEKLFSFGVLPYYLHQLDRVAGASHFEVSDSCALELRRQLSARLPGYLVPRLVREIAGSASKIELA